MLTRRACLLGTAALPLYSAACARSPDDDELEEIRAGGDDDDDDDDDDGLGEPEDTESDPGPIFTAAVPGPSPRDVVYGAPRPTRGWKSFPFRFSIQSPTNVPRDQRYQHQLTEEGDDIHHLTVVNGDSSFKVGNNTDPRTEMRWHEEYSAGLHMFDADLRVESVAPNLGAEGGEKGSCIMQILRVKRPPGWEKHATALMLSARPDGTIRPWFKPDAEVIGRFHRGEWLNLKVSHDVARRQIRIFINDVQYQKVFQDRGPALHHFKNGVYGAKKQKGAGDQAGSTVVAYRNIRYWKR